MIQIRDMESKLQELKEHIRWIPIKEKLPEEGVDVLVCDKYGEIRIANGEYVTFEDWKTWGWDINGFTFGKVVAWKPLPEPYYDEKESEW